MKPVSDAFNISVKEKERQQEQHYQSIKELIAQGQLQPLRQYIKSHKPELNFKTSAAMPQPYLHLAVQFQQSELFDFFAKAGCDLGQYDLRGDHLVDTASKLQDAAMLEHLLSHAECMEQVNSGLLATPLEKAVSDRDVARVQRLYDVGADINVKIIGAQNLAFTAVRKDDLEMLQMLHQLGADLAKVRDAQENNLVTVAAMNGSKNVMPYLLAHNVDPNQVNDYENTPLYYAAQARNTEMFECLVKAGADKHIRDKYGRTMLHQMVVGRHLGAVLFLLEAGLDREVRDDNGQTARDIALEQRLTNIACILGSTSPSKKAVQRFRR